MSQEQDLSLDLIVLDDDEQVLKVVSKMIQLFYQSGPVHAFSSYDQALAFLREKKANLAVFVLDVFLGDKTAFDFLDEVATDYPMAHEDSVIITGLADDEVVEQCMQKGVHHLLEKPLRPFALQLAIRAIEGKYAHFARRLLQDPDFAEKIINLDNN